MDQNLGSWEKDLSRSLTDSLNMAMYEGANLLKLQITNLDINFNERYALDLEDTIKENDSESEKESSDEELMKEDKKYVQLTT